MLSNITDYNFNLCVKTDVFCSQYTYSEKQKVKVSQGFKNIAMTLSVQSYFHNIPPKVFGWYPCNDTSKRQDVTINKTLFTLSRVAQTQRTC